MVEVNVYCDEVIRPDKRDYLIMGAVLIEEKDLPQILKELEICRQLNPKCLKWHYRFENCSNSSCKESLHNKNNTTIHFNELRENKERKKIAIKWVDYLKRDAGKKIKFCLLVIDLKKLECSQFGEEKTDLNIYNRFFRTLLKGALKHLFYGRHASIKQVYHDEGSQQKHEYFPELNLEKLEIESSSDFLIKNKRIIFVNSDHRDYLKKDELELVDHSQLIQLVDIILGSFSQLFLNTSEMEDKKEVAEHMRNLFNKIMDRTANYSSSVSFFPKLSIHEIENIGQRGLSLNRFNRIEIAIGYQGNFYNRADLAMPPFLGKQKDLSSWR